MPTQAQIDKDQKRTKAHTGTIGIQAKSGGIHDLSTSFIVPKKEFPQTGKRPIQDSDEDFVGRERTDEDGGSGGGVPAGYEEVLRDYVDDDNTAQQEYYLTKAV